MIIKKGHQSLHYIFLHQFQYISELNATGYIYAFAHDEACYTPAQCLLNNQLQPRMQAPQVNIGLHFIALITSESRWNNSNSRNYRLSLLVNIIAKSELIILKIFKNTKTLKTENIKSKMWIWKVQTENRKLKIENWKFKIKKWKLTVENWKLTIKIWKLRIKNWKLKIKIFIAKDYVN